MHLDEYLFRNKITQRKFADEIDITSAYLSHIINGVHVPSVKLAKNIEEKTQGQVGWVELINTTTNIKKMRGLNV